MTITSNTDHVAAIENQPSRFRLLRRGLAMAAIAVAGAAAPTVAGAAAPDTVRAEHVHAPQAYTTATFNACFKAPVSINGYTYWLPWQRQVIVDVLSNGTARQLTTLWTAGNGCISARMNAGFTYRLRVYIREAGFTWLARTGWQYAAAGYTYNFGTVWIQALPTG